VAKNIYVGNLPWSASEADIRELFEQHGPVQEVTIITDRETGRSRGFAFVLMDEEVAQEAIDALNGTDFGGRALRVNEARERSGGGDRDRGGRRDQGRRRRSY
jgi:RNA recognition motif-containing protein